MAEPSIRQWAKETVKSYWRHIIPIALATAIVAGASGAWPIMWQMMIDRAVGGIVSYWLAATVVVLLLVQISPVISYLRTQFLNRYEFETRSQFLKHVLRLSPALHREKESTKIYLEADKGISAGAKLLRLFLQGDIFVDVPVAVFAWSYIVLHDMFAAVILLVFLAVFGRLSYILGLKIAAVISKAEELDNEIKARQREVLQHVDTVKLHRAEQQESEWYEVRGRRALQLEHANNRYSSWFDTMAGAAHLLPYGIALLLFLPSLAGGTITVGTLMALLMFSARVVGPAGYLGRMYQEIIECRARLIPALRLLQCQPTVVESSTPIEMKQLRHQIEIQNITFCYPDTEEPALRNVSLTIPAGESVAVVGRSGSGKTTLARMLVRFFDPDHGIITMDGTDLRQISFDSLYRQISYVTQEIPIFTGTIGENVAFGLSDVAASSILDACRLASADFVFRKYQGLDTQVGELGERLAGGERQRIALARIFLREPSILILDEATAALDPITEREVQDAFDRLLTLNGVTTMIVIAHRISTVKNADRIVVMDRGCIVDTGTHQELRDRCELYQELCRGLV